ncbi:NAD(P)-dependent oxidoreductase [Sporosarcina obsidiansis]|uniref:NAD(P)-dependent oxidoreductase n=1 Tax=Sporosarcina obsidiansis TaxID=2660748 RepID=UPI00129B6453|nr:NAD(P)-dependent oxidoreductase [Sporosarcina obsidiansis]
MKKRIGFIGFGEAASQISEGLLAEGVAEICAYDANQDDQKFGPAIRGKANDLQVVLKDSLHNLALESDILISATSAKYAISVAKEIKPFLTENHLFVDLNAASPQVKKEINTIIAGLAKFVDVAVMESVPKFQHRVPLLASGEGAKEFAQFGSHNKMDITVIDEEPGSASAIKMIRSVFMKGFTMLLIETLSVSEQYAVTDEILESIDRSLRGNHIYETSNGLITRTAIHAERRVSEMKEVISTLEDRRVDVTMSEATKTKLEMLVRIGLKDHFLNQMPVDFQEVIKAIHLAKQFDS